MSSNKKTAGLAICLVLVVGFLYYTFTAPYARFPGIRIGGEQSAAPADWSTISNEPVVLMKLAGFPPFVIRVWFVPEQGGLITASRPDDGYWGNRVRGNPNGWLRIRDQTYATQAREILGDERIPYLEKYGNKYGMPMGYEFEGEIIVGANEPLHIWEVFYWTAR